MMDSTKMPPHGEPFESPEECYCSVETVCVWGGVLLPGDPPVINAGKVTAV